MVIKKVKDRLIKTFLGDSVVPRGLVELQQYFRLYNSINFDFKQQGEVIVAVSTDFQYGSIVTSGKDAKDLDRNIKDAILTSFSVPAAYAQEAKICRMGEKTEAYALA